MISRNIFILFLFSVISLPLFSQSVTFETSHYSVTSENGLADARAFANQLEVFWEFFNQYFRFKDEPNRTKLKVRLFSSQFSYNSYLDELGQPVQEGFVYLHYGRTSKNILLGYLDATESVRASLSRNAFLQFLRSNIPYPPTWLAEGFGVYLEIAQYDPQRGSINFTESASRAESLQQLLDPDNILPLSLMQFFAADAETLQNRPQEFYAMAWGSISFLLNSPSPQHQRILWDMISRLSPTESAEFNAKEITGYLSRWSNIRELESDLVLYISGLRTFRSIMGEGIRLYQEKNYEAADVQFKEAMQLQPDNYAPYYYRGLINYEQRNYDIAEAFYEGAEERNMDEHLANYVFGLILYAQGETELAIERLERIPEQSPYFNRSVSLLSNWRDG